MLASPEPTAEAIWERFVKNSVELRLSAAATNRSAAETAALQRTRP